MTPSQWLVTRPIVLLTLAAVITLSVTPWITNHLTTLTNETWMDRQLVSNNTELYLENTSNNSCSTCNSSSQHAMTVHQRRLELLGLADVDLLPVQAVAQSSYVSGQFNSGLQAVDAQLDTLVETDSQINPWLRLQFHNVSYVRRVAIALLAPSGALAARAARGQLRGVDMAAADSLLYGLHVYLGNHTYGCQHDDNVLIGHFLQSNSNSIAWQLVADGNHTWLVFNITQGLQLSGQYLFLEIPGRHRRIQVREVLISGSSEPARLLPAVSDVLYKQHYDGRLDARLVQPQHICLASIQVGHHGKTMALGPLSALLFERYCQTHGYRCVQALSTNDPVVGQAMQLSSAALLDAPELTQLDTNRGAAFFKLRLMSILMQSYDCQYVWWVDSDAIVLQMHKPLQEFIQRMEQWNHTGLPLQPEGWKSPVVTTFHPDLNPDGRLHPTPEEVQAASSSDPELANLLDPGGHNSTARRGADMFFAYDGDGSTLQTGTFLVRNTAWSRLMLRWSYEMREFDKDNPWWEQQSLNVLLRERLPVAWQQPIAIVQRPIFHAMAADSPDAPEALVWHLAGPYPQEEINRFWTRAVQSIREP